MTRSMTRREAWQAVGGVVLVSAAASQRVWAADPDRGVSFRFLVVNDTHYGAPMCGTYLEGLVRQMERHDGVAFCLHLGDLCDGGGVDSLKSVRRIFEKLGRPFYPQLGNHDYAAATDRNGYEQVFPDRVNYRFEHLGWQFLGVDSTEGQRYEHTTIQPATFEWLDRELPQVDRTRPLVLFTHFPLGAGVKYRPLNAEALLERFEGYDLRAAFSGHFHGYTERLWRGRPLVTNRCCARRRGNHDGSKEKGYWLCAVAGSELRREFVEYRGLMAV